MRRHALRQHIYPLAPDIGVAVTWELEAPEGGLKRCANEKSRRYAEDLV
jgi:hypothetical protein